MKALLAEDEKRGGHLCHFGPEANLFDKLEKLFAEYAETGTGKLRKYLHNAEEAEPFAQEPGTFTPWAALPEGSDLLFYEGLHGAVVGDGVNIARYPDLLIGVVPVVNLEWIQKINRDCRYRGYSLEAVTDVILRRMHDYVHYICPQFTRTHVNFQRVPIVDTSNPSSPAPSPRPTSPCSSSASPTPRASTSPTCSRCSTTRSCPAPTRSCARRQDGPGHAAHLHPVHRTHGRASKRAASA